MKAIIKKVLFLCLMSVSFGVFSSPLFFNGKVTDIRLYGNGMLLVYTSNISNASAVSSCIGTKSGFVVENDHPQKKDLLSMFMTARAMQANIKVESLNVPAGCWAATFTNQSYVTIFGP